MSMRSSKSDGLDFSNMRPIRSRSVSSDVVSSSTKSASTMHFMPHANPAPAYIAQSEASELLSAELNRKVDVSPSALTLLNEFLDNVLYSIISISHSVTLGQLKASVPIVLKPRLGKAALRVAEEELKEYMEDEEAEELYSDKQGQQPKADFDAELVWKLARLRCMVYARMGDLEEEDEEDWLDKENLLDQAAASSVSSRQSLAVNPASAIFLTSIIEYLGEQALYYAAQHAEKRHEVAQSQHGTTLDDHLALHNSDIVLEGRDMNHVGRDSPLSRLWRSWRRNTRSTGDASSRPMSPENMLSPGLDSLYSHTTSSSAHHSIRPILEEFPAPTTRQSAKVPPSQIPLPTSDKDFEETEGYGVSLGDSGLYADNFPKRPASMPLMPGQIIAEPSIPLHDDAPEYRERSPLRPTFERQRSSSVPVLITSVGTTANNRLVISSQEEDEGMDLPLQGGFEQPKRQSELVDRKELRKSPSSLVANSQPSAIYNSKRPSSATSPDQLNTTVGAIASALGVVGVHHIQPRNPQPVNVNQTPNVASKDSRQLKQPLTSASITRLDDFDVMHVSEDRPLPGEQETTRGKTATRGEGLSDQRALYHDSTTYSREDHFNHSQTLSKDIPSVYASQERAPRFPEDMRPVSRQSDQPERIESGYEPGSGPYVPYPRASSHHHDLGGYVRQTDSPISATSSKVFNSRPQHTEETVPELPTSQPMQQTPLGTAMTNRPRGHSKSSSSSSRLLGFTRDLTGRPQTIHQQRAAGDMSDEVRRAHSSTPNSATRNEGLATATPSSPQRPQHLRLRSDSGGKVYSSTDEDHGKHSLEELIESGETLHYTLTPPTATLKEDDADSPPKRTQTQELADFFRTTAPPGQEYAQPGASRSHKLSMDAARAPELAVTPEHKAVSSPKNIVLVKPQATKHKNPLGEPRGPTIDRVTSIRDLADYARSTGPYTDDQLPKPLSSMVPTVATNKPTSPVPKASVGTSAPGASRPVNRLKLQARDARPSRYAESTALIDFIREGPPREPGDHRINRRVAPFRTTMDSDDLNALASKLPKDSTDTNGIRSIDTTTNSQSPLLNNEARPSSKPKQHTVMRQPSVADAEDGMPKRTRRRVKDPYAIDDSDDELFNDTPKQTHEESLIDFLQNTAPSQQNMTALPVMSSLEEARSNLTGTASTGKLNDLVRGGRTNLSDLQSSQVPGARAESPHLTQIGSKLDSYRPTQATHAAHMDRNRRRSKSEARNPMKGYGATSDLADFLRNSAPPPSSEQQPQPFMLNNKGSTGELKQESGLKKFFSMRGRGRSR